MSIDAIKAKYFYQAADAAAPGVPPTEPAPPTFDGSRVTPLIDMGEFATALRAALATVGTVTPDPNHSFIFIANWLLGLLGGEFTPPPGSGFPGGNVTDVDPFIIDPTPSPPIRLIDVLKEKIRAGVDVRILGWVSPAVMDSSEAQKGGAAHIASINGNTMNAIKAMRKPPDPALRGAIMNIVGHTAGASHLKLTVVGNDLGAVAFTGGLDYHSQRWATTAHAFGDKWHDVQAQVEGNAVQDLYNTFKELWNENLRSSAKRFLFEGNRHESYTAGTPSVPDRVLNVALLPPFPGTHHVQSLHTAPAANYTTFNMMPEGNALSRFPNGYFALRAAWRKAILAAEAYVYIEDQCFWSSEVMDWIHDAIVARPALKVVLITSGEGDPNDPDFAFGSIWTEGLNNHLLAGLSAAQIDDQIRMYRLWGAHSVHSRVVTLVAPAALAGHSEVTTDLVSLDAWPEDELASGFSVLRQAGAIFEITGNPAITVGGPRRLIVRNNGAVAPVLGPAEEIRTQGLVAHSKITIIDDNWALIGSANVARRSLYTDFEHSVSFADELGTGVKEFRKRLWAGLFRSATLADFDDIQGALKGWEPNWFLPIAAFPLQPVRDPLDPGPPYFERILLPVPVVATTPELQERFDRFQDPDSRQPWGGLRP